MVIGENITSRTLTMLPKHAINVNTIFQQGLSMFDRKAIYGRFFENFPGMRRADVAKIFDVSWSTVRHWETASNPVPWNKLRYLVVTNHITWDWLLEGQEPKYWQSQQERDLEFDRVGINTRFLAYFAGKSKTGIGRELGVTHSAVCSWYSFRRQVPWTKLQVLVAGGVCSWEWLIDGTADGAGHC